MPGVYCGHVLSSDFLKQAPASVALLCGAGQWALPRDAAGPQAGSEQAVREHGRRLLGLLSSFHYSCVMRNYYVGLGALDNNCTNVTAVAAKEEVAVMYSFIFCLFALSLRAEYVYAFVLKGR